MEIIRKEYAIEYKGELVCNLNGNVDIYKSYESAKKMIDKNCYSDNPDNPKEGYKVVERNVYVDNWK